MIGGSLQSDISVSVIPYALNAESTDVYFHLLPFLQLPLEEFCHIRYTSSSTTLGTLSNQDGNAKEDLD